MEHALPESIKEEVIERSALPHSGYSGAELQRVRLRDGSRLVLKHITPEGDWGLRVTRDRGREAALWTTGVLNRVADVIDYPVVSVELGAVASARRAGSDRGARAAPHPLRSYPPAPWLCARGMPGPQCRSTRPPRDRSRGPRPG